ncbi:uL15 family ribosomal protein [Candidatus Woesearchaeota archaeon]|nr:uL15 family ribosomal protein [Candidatus Woesearchaeota archaeon]MBL7050588.1 uL15 family ribosomal protein [Candidatus Woesearchaeota archaeon]
MTTNRLKKKVKYRGSKTHGCGSMKKRRGAGHRGGRGAAGSGKRGDAKKPSIWKGKYFGKYGFTSRFKAVKTINLKEIEIKLPIWIKKGLAKENKDVFEIDLNNLSYGKLLGNGTLTKKLKLKINSFSKKAEEKIKKAGGELM